MRRWMAAALVALAWTTDARAAAPQSDPLVPPSFTVTPGDWATEDVHPADGDTFTATPGGWSGVGNTYGYQWQRCTAAGSGCSDIPGATSATFVPDSLFGAHLRLAVTATNPGGSTTAYSAPTRRLVDETAHLRPGVTAPSIQGRLAEGETLTLDAVTSYVGSRPLSDRVVWQRCDGPASTQPCHDLPWPGGRNASYALTETDVGSHMRAYFHVFNGAGTARLQYTVRVGPVGPNTSPPAGASAPSVSGAPVDGGTVQGAAGSWTGARPMTYALQWLRCDAGGCTEIEGATISQYRPGTDDLGRRLRLRVTARNQYGEAVATSEPSAAVAPAPPAPATAPSLDGTALDGQLLSGTRGTFTGTGPMTEAVAWERCDATGDGCSTIAGASGATHTLVPADVGRRLRFKVTARNDAGSATARSAPSEVVRAIAPAATDLPAVSGTTRDEETLSGTVGAWTGSPDIAYARQWMRCGDAGCTPIPGATGATYALAAEDVGSRVRLRVVASNFGNAVTALSEPTAVVAPSAPRALDFPAADGEARDGEAMTARPGAWKGTGPLAHSYRWERCVEGAGCSAIEGAVDAVYRLTGADVGRRVRVVVTATGRGGVAEAPSAPVGPVAAVAPSAVSAPEVAGTARDGGTLTATAGAWEGTRPMTTGLRWERCSPECAPIAGASGATYALTPADVGSRIRVVQRAANAGGEAEAASALSSPVTARAPQAAAAPAISGVARDEETLTAERGNWTGTPELTFARRWLRCSSASDLSGCETIPQAGEPSLRLSGDDVGGFLRVRVTAANAAGEASAVSEAVGPVVAATPASVATDGPVLRIVGDADQSAPDVGDRVTVEHGRWAGTAREMTFAYRWERCDTSGCSEVAGRTGATEAVTADDVGRQLRVVVTARNSAGSAAQATPRLGITRAPSAAPAAPGPAAVTGSPSEARSPSPAESAGLPAGSLLAPEACQVLARMKLRAGGAVLSVPAGTASAAAPLVATVKAPRAKRVALRAGAKAVKLRRAGRGRFTAALKPAVLARAQLLQLAVTPRRGKPVKASARLAAKPCQALLTVRLKGGRLALRVDQRAAIGRVSFTLPKGLGVKTGSARLESLPFGGGGPTTSRPEIRLAGRTLTLDGLPPRTAAATLTVALAGKARRGRALRFSAVTDTSRLSATSSLRR